MHAKKKKTEYNKNAAIHFIPKNKRINPLIVPVKVAPAYPFTDCIVLFQSWKAYASL